MMILNAALFNVIWKCFCLWFQGKFADLTSLASLPRLNESVSFRFSFCTDLIRAHCMTASSPFKMTACNSSFTQVFLRPQTKQMLPVSPQINPHPILFLSHCLCLSSCLFFISSFAHSFSRPLASVLPLACSTVCHLAPLCQALCAKGCMPELAAAECMTRLLSE